MVAGKRSVAATSRRIGFATWTSGIAPGAFFVVAITPRPVGGFWLNDWLFEAIKNDPAASRTTNTPPHRMSFMLSPFAGAVGGAPERGDPVGSVGIGHRRFERRCGSRSRHAVQDRYKQERHNTGHHHPPDHRAREGDIRFCAFSETNRHRQEAETRR